MVRPIACFVAKPWCDLRHEEGISRLKPRDRAVLHAVPPRKVTSVRLLGTGRACLETGQVSTLIRGGPGRSMDLGFETIGNATLVCHDRAPVLVTDPWITGDAYFGSWTLSHVIPDDVLEAIRKVRFVWVSHGHPDHLSPRSISLLRDKTMLLPDHVGGRIAKAFKEQGYDVRILEDRQWTTLSDRIRVLCISDYNQDGILLLDIGGRLVANLNDSSDHGWGRFVKNLIGRYEISFLLRLSGFGDADMINLYDEQGRSIPPYAAQKRPVGREISALLRECRGR